MQVLPDSPLHTWSIVQIVPPGPASQRSTRWSDCPDWESSWAAERGGSAAHPAGETSPERDDPVRSGWHLGGDRTTTHQSLTVVQRGTEVSIRSHTAVCLQVLQASEQPVTSQLHFTFRYNLSKVYKEAWMTPRLIFIITRSSDNNCHWPTLLTVLSIALSC